MKLLWFFVHVPEYVCVCLYFIFVIAFVIIIAAHSNIR